MLAMPHSIAQRRAAWEHNKMIPGFDIDPFCTSFFDDPYPAHAAMRDTLRGKAILPIRCRLHDRGCLSQWRPVHRAGERSLKLPGPTAMLRRSDIQGISYDA
jgi:hypothetical protein